MVWKLTTSWLGTFVAFCIVAGWWALQTLPPASYWYQPRAIIVADADEAQPIVLLVDRVIRRPFRGEWNVTIRRRERHGWVVFCSASGQTIYSPSSVLPETLTLSWWTDGQCEPLPAGEYTIYSTWTIFPELAAGTRTTGRLISNPFTIHSAEE